MAAMVMEASRAEYLANDKYKQQLGHKESSTSGAEPSSSAASKCVILIFLFEVWLAVDLGIFFMSNAILIINYVDELEPGSSGGGGNGSGLHASVLSSSMQIVLSMGFSYLQAVEAYSIFGDDVDSMVCYLLETSSSSRRKGKATE